MIETHNDNPVFLKCFLFDAYPKKYAPIFLKSKQQIKKSGANPKKNLVVKRPPLTLIHGRIGILYP